ncbi:hypothetical protein QQS21_010347 [Conoideocrella luteorostrata]|uniref:Uncharacterized protein n=1 Tax=Conoideocrella luteorostrata TaxID=1105319 RepID=A0AAJ0FUR9_9HYPO|nr:hypothetical protein QQS21_010347 [Conoideocrella luteorostrata]
MTILTVNLLLGLMAWLRKDISEAYNFTVQGLGLIRRWNLWECAQTQRLHQPESISTVESILAAYVRHDSFTRHMCGASPSRIEELDMSPPWAEGWRFTSSSDAHQQLEFIWNWLMKLMRKRPILESRSVQLQPGTDIRYSFRLAAERWKERFHDFRSSKYYADDEENAIAILGIRYLFVEVLLAVDITGLELSWDAFKPNFENITSAAEVLSRRFDERSVDEAKTPSQTEESNRRDALALIVCELLLQVVWRCRCPILRRKALALLKIEEKRRPGDVRTLVTDLAEIIITTEEKSWLSDAKTIRCGCIAGGYICSKDRIIDYHMEWQPDQKVSVYFRMKGDVEGHYLQQKVQMPY